MVYFDNSATTPTSESSVKAVLEGLKLYGNPSSGHIMGQKAAAALKRARQTVAAALHTSPDNIYFTSSGTIADNIAIFGGAKKSVGNHAVTTAAEHHAVLKCFEELERRGFDVTYIPPEGNGNISVEKFLNSLRPNTSLVSIMTVNNETGAIMPVNKVRPLMDRVCPRALFHTDAVQAFGKIELFPEKWGVDLLSISGHKLHAPKGIGALFIREGVHLSSVVFGGGQEKGIHSGTENLPGIMGLEAAVSEIDYDDSTVREINNFLREEIKKFPFAEINSPKNASPYVLNVSFGGIPSEIILNALSAEGICASAGSACSGSSSSESHVLKAMGKNSKSAIRLSFSKYNTMDEAEKCAKVLHEIIPKLNFVIGGQA